MNKKSIISVLLGVIFGLIVGLVQLGIELNEARTEARAANFGWSLYRFHSNKRLKKLETMCPQVKEVVEVEDNDEFRG